MRLRSSDHPERLASARGLVARVLVGISLGLIALLSSSLVGGVQPVEAKHIEHHATLHPASVSYQYRSTTYVGGSFLSGCLIGAPDYDPTSAGMPVGYAYHTCGDNDAGISNAYQTRVIFDVSEFQRYALVRGDPVYASLTYQEQFMDRTEPAPAGSQGVTCVNRLRVATTDATQDGRFIFQDGDLFRAGLLNSDPWSVGDVVKGWIDGGIPNFGLVLQGYDESLDLKTEACLSDLSNFTLDVGVVWNAPAPDLRVQNLYVFDKNGDQACTTGTIRVGSTIHNESDVGSANYDVVLKVDGQARETIIAPPIGSYTDWTGYFQTRLDLSAGNHTLQVLVDPDHQVTRIDDPDDASTVSVNCAQGAAPTPTPRPAGLQVTSLDVQDPDNGRSRCIAGSSNDVHVVIKNTGDAGVSAVIPIQLNIDGKPGRTTTVGGVAANAEKDAYFTGVTLSAGNHSLKVTIDPDRTLSVGVASNNATKQVNCTKTGGAS
jgi:hypothetical protein